MKKTYIIPLVALHKFEVEKPLAASGVTTHQEDIDIDYGGVDENGEKEADSRYQNPDMWEEEENEEEDW